MGKNNSKEKNKKIPIEKHDTASWANINKTKEVSNVTQPSEIQMNNNKEWVDTNEK